MRGAAWTLPEHPAPPSAWDLSDDEERMPESPLQGDICDLLKAVLAYFCKRRGVSALVGGHIALRWDPLHPRQGVDPDVYLVEPAPPLGARAKSLRTWMKGHKAPRVAVEVVSESTAEADYFDKPARYAQAKVGELWVFDPLRLGPGVDGGPFVLQVWRRKRGRWTRVYAGDGPAQSEELGAWLVVTDEGLRLRIADDPAGNTLWPTETDAERAAKEAERAAKEAALAMADAERAAKEAALAELAQLRAELARRG
jgi:Uma2 family endonuclease